MKKINIMFKVIFFILTVAIIWGIINFKKITNLLKSDTAKNKNTTPITGNVNVPGTVSYISSGGNTTQQVVLDAIIKTITSSYTVLASDTNKRLVVKQPVALTFGPDGNYNVLVRAFPVTIKQGSTIIQDLDAGDYIIEVSSGNVTIIS